MAATETPSARAERGDGIVEEIAGLFEAYTLANAGSVLIWRRYR